MRNGYKIYVDIMTGENCPQFMLLAWSFIGQFINPLVGEGMWYKGWISIFYPATSLTLLDYMIIWCKVQVIIYPLFAATKLRHNSTMTWTQSTENILKYKGIPKDDSIFGLIISFFLLLVSNFLELPFLFLSHSLACPPFFRFLLF